MTQSPAPAFLSALQNPDLYQHPVSKFTLLETHISWVLLTGDYAYKIKKPVNLGFLDFSTLEQRRHYCCEEIRLNGRLAPTLYLQVVAISGSEEHPNIAQEDGDIFEYAVKMRQFPQQNLLLTMLDSERLQPEHIDQLADVIAEFHRTAAVADSDAEYGSAKAVLAPVTENFRQLRRYIDNEFEQQLQAVETWSLQEHHRLRAVFFERKQAGFIRECHGDLHLGNIVLYQDNVTPFDGLEFNPGLYWIDVINEIAFLAMDLDERGRSDLGFRFLNAYLERTGDYQGLTVLPYYLSYRAMVRAKVNAIRLDQLSDRNEQQACRQEFSNYLRLARRYIQSVKPTLIICHGWSGSGKTTVSQLLLERLQAIRVRSDIERKRLHGLDTDQRSRSDLRAGIYHPSASEKTYRQLLQLAAHILDAGYTTIVDATFLQHRQRHYFQELANRKDLAYLIVDCVADPVILQRRIEQRQQRGKDASEADTEVLNEQIKNHQALTEQELAVCVRINTESDIDMSPILDRLASIRCE